MPVVHADFVPKLVATGASCRVHEEIIPRFKVGDRVVTRNLNPTGHTRLPRYVRGKQGVIVRDHGVFVFPDTLAAGLDERPQHVYTVRFTARELWGREGGNKDTVLIDAWDDYMDLA